MWRERELRKNSEFQMRKKTKQKQKLKGRAPLLGLAKSIYLYVCLKVSENIFWVCRENIIYFSKIDFEKCFMVNRIKQPEGCIGISEKCDLQGKVCRVATGSNLNGFFLATVVFFFLT